jgi:hypothetical protein
MPLRCDTIIQAARDVHPAFTPQRHPDRTLARLLSAEQRRLVGKIAQVNPSAIAVPLLLWLDAPPEPDPEAPEAPAPEVYDFDAGFVMPSYHAVHGGDAIARDGKTAPMKEVSWGNRTGFTPMFTYFLHGGRFHLKGSRRDEWEWVQAVKLSYLPVPGEIDRLQAELVLPEYAEACLVAFLAKAMAGRSEGLNPHGFLTEWKDAEADLIREIRSQYKAKVIRTTAYW